MTSTDTTIAGVSTVTSPAAGLRCSVPADRIVSMATYAAPWNGTGVPVAGCTSTVRLRGLGADAGTTGSRTTGAPIGTDGQPSAQTTALEPAAFAGATARHTSSTPGDLPPEDPLS